MTKRETAITNALSSEKKVDLTSVVETDVHSLKGLLHAEEGKLMQIEKNIKELLSNPTITLGSEFVNLFENKDSITARINTINQAISYVTA